MRRAIVVTGLLLLGLVAPPAAAAAPVTAAPEPPPAAVMDANEAYITAVYADLFGRSPDATGLATWKAKLAAGTPRVEVANAITGSTEFRTGLITSAYDWYLDREPDAAGLKYWLDQMAKGVTIAQIESGFLASAEYRALAGDAATWVVYLYLDVLDREPSDAEVAYWVGRLAKGTNPRDVALGFLLSTEYLTTVVGGYYDWLLGRPLDPTGTKTWVGILQKGGRDEWIIGGIVASDEYWKLVTT